MLKSFPPKTVAFDAEWVPCAQSARRLLGLSPLVSERAAMEALWAKYARDDDPRPFLKLVLSQVVSIAAVVRAPLADGRVGLRLYAAGVAEQSEGALIQDFLERVALGQFQLWGFNSAGADVPILVQRALALGVPCPTFNQRPRKAWEGMDYHDARNGEAHKDILQVIGGFSGAAKPSLHELAAACGLPGKLDVAGDQVADLYLAGDFATILDYNRTDAVTTHLLMLRVAYVSGHLDEAGYAAEVEAVRGLVAREAAKGSAQLAKFAAAWREMEGG